MNLEKNFTKDIETIANASYIDWHKLKDAKILITGATGLIGYATIDVLACANKLHNLNLKLLALVRDEGKAKERFKYFLNDSALKFVVGSVEQLPNIEENIDYIIHGASQTASKGFVDQAAETIDTAVTGTKNLLELAKNKKCKNFVYLSSMEVYGYPKKGHKVTEEEIGTFNPTNLRNSYPISKMLCENMCEAYTHEYDVPTNVIRLTQTFGLYGISPNDNRIFAYISRCAKEKKNIVLKTKGDTERSYLYTPDATGAILLILLDGKSGEIYNVADESTYCSIAEMAEKIANEYGIKVEYDIQDNKLNGFPDTLYMDLDTTKLKALGWKPIGGALQ